MYFTVPYFLCCRYLLHYLRIMDIRSLLHCKVPCQMSVYKGSLLLLRLEGRRVFLLHKVRKVELSGNIYIGIKINLPPWTNKNFIASCNTESGLKKWILNKKKYRSSKSKCKTNVFLCELPRQFEDKLRRFRDLLCVHDQEIKIRGTLERCS